MNAAATRVLTCARFRARRRIGAPVLRRVGAAHVRHQSHPRRRCALARRGQSFLEPTRSVLESDSSNQTDVYL
eukprot:2121718-Rhodomonas_salina.1